MQNFDFLRPILLLLFAGLVLVRPGLAGSYEDSLDAARMGDTRTLTNLLSRGLDPDTVDINGNTLLILAAREGHARTITAMLPFRPKLGYRNRAGDSALMLASLAGDEEIVELLLKAGAPVDHDGWTPLHYAAFNGHTTIVERLLAAGANVNALTPNHANALMLAARNGHIDIVKRLLQTPVNLYQVNDAGLTADSWARKHHNTDAAKLIREERKRRGESQPQGNNATPE